MPQDSNFSNASISQLYSAASEHAPVTPPGHDLASIPSNNFDMTSSSQPPATAHAPPGFEVQSKASNTAPMQDHSAHVAAPQLLAYPQQVDWSSRPETADSFVSGQSSFISNQSSFQQPEQVQSAMLEQLQSSDEYSQPSYTANDAYAPTAKLAELSSEPEPTFDDLFALLTS